MLAIAAGIVAYLVSCLVEPARSNPHGFGLQWRDMSEQPFAFLGQLPHRMLTPLLAHMVGLSGDSFTDFTRLSGAVMLALVFWPVWVAWRLGVLRTWLGGFAALTALASFGIGFGNVLLVADYPAYLFSVNTIGAILMIAANAARAAPAS